MKQFKRKPYSSLTLLPAYEDTVNDFLEHCADIFSDVHLDNIRRRCRLFLKCMQFWGRKELHQITYTDIFCYHQELSHLKEISKIIEESSLHQFLKYLAEQEQTRYGLYLYLYQLECNEVVMVEDFNVSDQKRVDRLRQEGFSFAAEAFREKASDLILKHREAGYAKSYVDTMERAILYFYVFLELNELGYRIEIADIWLNSDAVKAVIRGSSWMAASRIFSLFQHMEMTGAVDFHRVFRNGISGLKGLPLWCRVPLEDFALQRTKEKIQETTVKNDIYSVLRFCRFLLQKHVQSFEDLSGEIVAEFNLIDQHGSSDGKNACNSRVRRFLKYLYREKLTSNDQLHLALGATAASSEPIVQILSDSEIESIKKYIAQATTPIELRDCAVILLGADMGLRGSDIVSLRLSDIDWKNRCIRLHQKKTGVEVHLAMPVSVGNAIYRYLRDGRPRNIKSDYIFVGVRTPFHNVGRHICYQTLHRILPNRSLPGSGFHVTRKSFSTNRLRNGVSPVMIADAMGHRGTESLTSYLSLDAEKMALCPLSLADLRITMGGRF